MKWQRPTTKKSMRVILSECGLANGVWRTHYQVTSKVNTDNPGKAFDNIGRRVNENAWTARSPSLIEGGHATDNRTPRTCKIIRGHGYCHKCTTTPGIDWVEPLRSPPIWLVYGVSA